MQNQFLPIGSICTLVNNNKKVMIIGYNPQIYNGTIKSADYLGCTYPEGFLLPSMMTTFMESEISKVDFMGYKDAAYSQFVKSVSKEVAPVEIPQRNKENIQTDKKEIMNQATYQFDENGVVIVDPFANNLTPSEVRPADYKFDAVADARYVFDEDGMIIADRTVNENTTSKSDITASKGQYKFDENGVVIEDNNVVSEQTAFAIANNQYKFDENGVIIKDNTEEEKTNSAQNSPYEFDKDGMIIADRTAQAITNNQYKFDENGVVIEDNTSYNQMSKPNAGAMYEFDTDGVITADYSENQVNSQTIPEIKIDDIVPKYKFDENGVIIADNTIPA